MGRTKLLPDGRLSTLVEGDYIMPRCISDGATAVRFLGVMRKAKKNTQKNTEGTEPQTPPDEETQFSQED